MNTPIYDQLVSDFRREYRAVPGEHVPRVPVWPSTPHAEARFDAAEPIRAPDPAPPPMRHSAPTGPGPIHAGPGHPGPAHAGPVGPLLPGPLLPGPHLPTGGWVGARGGWQFPPPDAFPTQPLPPTLDATALSLKAPDRTKLPTAAAAEHRPALPPSTDAP